MVILWHLPYDSKMEGGGHSGWSARLFWFSVLVFSNYLLNARGFTEPNTVGLPHPLQNLGSLLCTSLYCTSRGEIVPELTADSNSPVYSRLTSIQPPKYRFVYLRHFNPISIPLANLHGSTMPSGLVVALAGAVTVYLLLRALVRLTQDSREPPMVETTIPFITPILGMGSKKADYYIYLR